MNVQITDHTPDRPTAPDHRLHKGVRMLNIPVRGGRIIIEEDLESMEVRVIHEVGGTPPDRECILSVLP